MFKIILFICWSRPIRGHLFLVCDYFDRCTFLWEQASDFSDVGDWPTLGEAAMTRPKEEIVQVGRNTTWTEEVQLQSKV